MGRGIDGGLNISMLTILLVNYNDNKSSTLEVLFPREEIKGNALVLWVPPWLMPEITIGFILINLI
jgi:hypothetical protein